MLTTVARFSDGEQQWIERLGHLRNVIRQEMIARQLSEHVAPTATVLDVGCGQGTQALRLAARGSRVTGVDPSLALLARFAADAEAGGLVVELIEGTIDQLDALLHGRLFDVVSAHGLVMYLADRRAALSTLARRVAPGGRLSITFRNGHALAFRPAMRRDWTGALAAFDARDYVNDLGVAATAHRIEEVEDDLAAAGFEVVTWFGVRVFNDAVPVEMPVPADEDMVACSMPRTRPDVGTHTGGWPPSSTSSLRRGAPPPSRRCRRWFPGSSGPSHRRS